MNFFNAGTALHLAVLNNRIDIVSLLLENPSLDVNAIYIHITYFNYILKYILIMLVRKKFADLIF